MDAAGPEQTRYEPLPRWGHVSVVIENKLYLWGGRIEDFSEESKKEFASVVEVFDFETELWMRKTTTGAPPPGLYNTAYTTIGDSLYVYGGWDGHLAYNNLHKLDITTMVWTELKPVEHSETPMKMSGCGLVSFGKNKLVLFGGCGIPTEESQTSGKSGSGTVSYVTVRSNEGSRAGASQEEDTKLLEITDEEMKFFEVAEGQTRVEVHSQPESVANSHLTGVSEGALGLYELAVSQLNSQVSYTSEALAASHSEEPSDKDGHHKAAESKTSSQTNSQVADAPSEEVKEEEPKVEKAVEPAEMKKAVESEVEKVEPEQAESEETKSPPSHSQEEKGEVTVTTAVSSQENGEVKVQQAPQENGLAEAQSEEEQKSGKSPSHSQEEDVGAGKIGNGTAGAESATPTPTQNGDIKVQISTDKEQQPSSKSPPQHKKVEIQALPQVKEDEKEERTAEGEESEEESDAESDVMDRRWTNELKVFNIKEGTWMTPLVRGELPPPCVDFSFTCLDEYRTLMYGGFQPESGTSNEAYILNMETWQWSRLRTGDISEEVTWPVGRDGHASCLLAGPPNPQVLVSGGWDKDNKLINDAWILSINERVWKELTMPVVVGARFWHSVSCYQFSQRMKQLLFFGGCPGAPEELLSGGCWAKLAATVVVELGLMDPIMPVISASRFSVDDDLSGPSDWVVLDATEHHDLGLPNKRLKERVLLAEYRAIRAENIAREVLKKLETIDLHSISAPYDLPHGRYGDVTPLPHKEEEEEEERKVEAPKELRPFWEISEKDIELTGVDIGKGRWSIVREAIYRGDRVAARCLYSKIISEDNFKVFIECMDTAAKLRHTNLLPFIGAVLEGEPIIITELMPYNLKKVLDMKGQLLNYQIVGIALDVARALNFLHTAKPEPVVHGDLMSTSVLLEQGKGNSWRAKLSDFMTAKFFNQLISTGTDLHELGGPTSPISPSSHHSEVTPVSRKNSRGIRSRSSSIGSNQSKKGTMVTPPDILDPTNFTPKRDVYSYGLLLIEMCSGSTPHIISMNFLLESITWTEMNVLIRECIELDPDDRLSMEVIVPKMAEMHQSLSLGYGGPSRPAGIKKTFV